MGVGVDAARQPRGDDIVGGAEVAGDLAGETVATRRRVARADDGDDALVQEMTVADHRKQRRRIGDRGKRPRIVGLAERDQAGARRPQGVDLALGGGARANAQAAPPAAAPGQIGQGPERVLGRAEVAHQIEEGDRPNVLTTDQAQPGEPLGVGQLAPCLSHLRNL